MATDNWLLNGTANWNTAADWSAGVPTSTSNVVVSQGDPQITAAITIASLIDGPAAEVDFINAGSSTITGAVNNAGILNLDAGTGNGGSNLTIGGVLTNTGVAQFGAPDNSLTKSDTVKVAGFANGYGDLEVAGGQTATAQMLLDVTGGVAGFGTAGVLSGTVHLSGHALLEFAGGGQITSIDSDGTLALTGPNAFLADAGSLTTNSALAGLNFVAGNLDLDGGASVKTSGGLTNINTIEMSSLSTGPARN